GIYATGDEDDCFFHWGLGIGDWGGSARFGDSWLTVAGRTFRRRQAVRLLEARKSNLPLPNPQSLIPASHLPGASSHNSLCSCIWNRTGRRSATIQSARSLGDSSDLLGENSTSQRACRACRCSTSRAHS